MRYLIFILFGAFTCLAGQYDIPEDRKVDWTTYAGVKGGIPNVTTIYITLGTTVTVAQLNGHIDNCPSNQVIQFDAGTFVFTASIDLDNNGVVLRGSTNSFGFPTTIFRMDGANLYGAVHVNGTQTINDPCCTTVDNIRGWTAGYAKGTTEITLDSVTGLAVNKMMMLDQLNDLLLVSDEADEGINIYGREQGARLQLQFTRVMAINGNVVTIEPPLYMTNWVSGMTPKVWWMNDNPVEKVGLENIVFTNNVNQMHFISFMNARDCWMKNCESRKAGSPSGGEHIRTYMAHRITIRDSLFQKGVTTTSQSYGVNPYWCGDMLCENNVFVDITSPILLEQSSGGVFAYNFATNLLYSVNEDWLIEGFSTHGAHCNYNLFEGNWGPNYYLDYIHGSASHNVLFRSRLTGWESNKTTNTRAIAVQRFNRCISIVGNLLGTTNFHNQYERPLESGGQQIYDMGRSNTVATSENYDPEVTNSVIRHMNYDVQTITNGGIKYQHGISDFTLRNSMYLSTKPSWFGILPWPPYDPNITNSAGIAATNIPAGYRWWNGTNPPAAAGGQEGGQGAVGQRVEIPRSNYSIRGGVTIRQ